MTNNFWFVYILRCSDGSFYTGITNNVEERVKEHDTGNGAKYTRGRRPVTLVYRETHPNQSAARRREEEIKKWRKRKKEKLVLGFPRRHPK
ncbi:MAG TPA: GIY-YIG nuclease family protein [Verrucomicrobiae bacterium]|nr:GIY-YIG nuclease family protein [Verrucomicrobiae bacterium]